MGPPSRLRHAPFPLTDFGLRALMFLGSERRRVSATEIAKVDFWTSVLLASGRFRGNPRETHDAIPGIRPRHFDRWLELFRPVVDEVFERHVADDVFGRAQRMRVVLERSRERPARAGSG